MRELQALAQKLDETFRNEDPRPYMADLEASATGLNGVGGLLFRAEAPPGQGKLIRLPFYLYEGDKTQARFVQGYYSKDDVFQVETLEITNGGSGGGQTISIVLGDAANPDFVVATGTAAAVASQISLQDFSSVGKGWIAQAENDKVVFTCLQPGYVSGVFSFKATTPALIAGTFVRTQAGRVGRPEIRIAGFVPENYDVTTDLTMVVGGVDYGPISINIPPPVGNGQNCFVAVRSGASAGLLGIPAFVATWTQTNPGPNIPLGSSGLYMLTLILTSVANGPITGEYSAFTGTISEPSNNISVYYYRSQAGLVPLQEIRTLTITDFGSPGPNQVSLILNGAPFGPYNVTSGVSAAVLAASLAVSMMADPLFVAVGTAVASGDDVVITSNAYAAFNGAYSMTWTSGTLIEGFFTETTPGSSKEWVAANQPLWVTGKGIEEVDDSNPTVIVTIPNAPGASSVSGFRFRTPVLEWAKLRVVGFQVSTRPVPRGEYAFPPILNEVWPQVPMRGNDIGIDYSNPPPNTMSSNALVSMSAKGYSAYWRGSAPILLTKNLSVGGSANLFIQEGYIDTIAFSDGVPEFPGLRAYPVLEPPNRAYVDAAVVGQPLTGMTFSMCLLCDILDDADFGAPISGPYGRRDAMMRFDPPDGQGYVR